MNRAGWMVGCILLAGCDQFARIGTVAGEVEPPANQAEDAGPGSLDASAPSAPSCAHPSVAVCNPVTNTNCPGTLAMQCAVDLLSDAPAGYCTFRAPVDAGIGCLNTLVTESCPPTRTCIAGVCRELCFCDGDCSEGRCCAEPVGNTGFRVCGNCGEPATP